MAKPKKTVSKSEADKTTADQTPPAADKATTADKAEAAKPSQTDGKGVETAKPDAPKTEDAKADDIMVVGHQPFMGRMTSRLLVGLENIADVGFQPGTVVCLESAEDGRWVLAWMAGPELLGS